MGRASVFTDPARREAFLARVRKRPRITVRELADLLHVSVTTIFKMVQALETDGKVHSAIDPAARRTPRSSPPQVVWIGPKRTQRIGKPKIPRALGFTARKIPLPAWPYVHTGTPADLAGGVQILAIAGRR